MTIRTDSLPALPIKRRRGVGGLPPALGLQRAADLKGITMAHRKDGTPQAPKPSAIQMAERLEWAEKMMLACSTPSQVCKAGAAKFGVSTRTVKRWEDTVHKKWRDEAKVETERDIEERRHEQRRRLQQYINAMYGEKNFRLVLRAEELLAKLDGHLSPQRLDVTHKDGLMTDAAKGMSDEELRQVIKDATGNGDILH